MANGIEVYVITASQEELIRMVLADPKYGYNVKPQNIIGIATLLKNNTQLTTSRKQITDNTYDQKQNLNLVFTSHLWSPQAMFVGKYGAILTYINQWKMPILVAGDTPTSDGYMLFHAYNEQRKTVRLWVNRKDAYLTLIKQMKDQYVNEQKENNLTVTADQNWIYITPNELSPTNEILSNVTGIISNNSILVFLVLILSIGYYDIFCLGTSEFTLLIVATTTTHYNANEATRRQYQISVSLMSLFIIYLQTDIHFSY